MRKIDSVIIHCSATKAGMDFSVADIDRWHRARGMNGIGYHYVVGWMEPWKRGERWKWRVRIAWDGTGGV